MIAYPLFSLQKVFLQLLSVAQNFAPMNFSLLLATASVSLCDGEHALGFYCIDCGAEEQTLGGCWQGLVVNSDGGGVDL